MYFLRGNLPWQGLKTKTKDNKYQKILEKKKSTSSEELCKNFPIEFKQYIDYTKKLGYTENPNYDKLRKKFINVLTTMKENFDFIYDWTTQSDIKKRKDNNMALQINVYNKNDEEKTISFDKDNEDNFINDKIEFEKDIKDLNEDEDDDNMKFKSKC